MVFFFFRGLGPNGGSLKVWSLRPCKTTDFLPGERLTLVVVRAAKCVNRDLPSGLAPRGAE